MSDSIADKIDELLKDDKTFTTRAGLRFMTEVLKDAFAFIEEQAKHQNLTKDELESLKTRTGHVEKALFDFLDARKIEQEKAEAARVRWRWAILTPTIGLFFTTLGLLITEIIKIRFNFP